MTENAPLLVTICNDAWAYGHLLRWYRYAQLNSKCRLGLMLISDDEALVKELDEAFDEIVVFSAENDHRDFYNEVRLKAPKYFGQSVIYCDCDADVWGDLSGLVGGDAEIKCVKSPVNHGVWDEIDGRTEYNNGFLVLDYADDERCADIVESYKECVKSAVSMGASPRISGTIGWNLLLRSDAVTWEELPYSTSVIWWDDLSLVDAKVIQWCNDTGQAKRLALEVDYVNGERAL